MGILLKKIRIQNFRSIEFLEMELGAINLLIGQNNTGKSNFLRAINVALGTTTDVSDADIFVAQDERLSKTKGAVIDVVFCPTDANGKITDNFSEFWTSVFTESWVTTSAEGAFVGIRTELKLDIVKDSYTINRKCIRQWKDSTDAAQLDGKKLSFNEDMRKYIAAYYMDANRDIVQDLRNRKSFFGRVTSDYDMTEDKVKEIEEQLSNVNAMIVESIPSLQQTKERIAAIGRTIGSASSNVEIEPLTRKLSDLNRGMDIVMQDGGASFPISQNGYGTRSWISFLTLSAFVESQTERIKTDDAEAEQYVMLTMEEPEAHLHPQAQRQLFSQLQGFTGQKVISTHAPSVAAQSTLADYVYFSKQNGKTIAVRYRAHSNTVISEEKIAREVLNTRAELLFSSAIILCEGITEELALPVFFGEYFGCSPFSLGVNIIGIGGQNYKTYLSLIKDFEIPWCIFSDGETKAINTIKSAIRDVFGEDYTAFSNIIIIASGLNYEGYLVSENYSDLIMNAICEYEGDDSSLDSYITLKGKQKGKGGIPRSYVGEAGRQDALIDLCHDHKTEYALPVAKKIVSVSDKDKRIPSMIVKLFDVLAVKLGTQRATQSEEEAMNLSQKQQCIVDHIDGALLVKARPGSGKTRVLTERVKHLLSVKKRGKVLALTFSNMAADEMRYRLESDPDVDDSVERVSVSTIHSFCLDLLQSRGFLIGLRSDVSLFENDADRTAILRNLMLSEPEYATILRSQKKPNDFLSKCLSAISEQKRKLILPEASNENEPFLSIYRKYNDALASQNAIDFDDILFFTYRIFAENLDVVKLYNSVYRYICIDEAQDLNEAQYRVIQALCGNDFSNIMMVGDENQSIYAFNGSSSKYMSEYFVRDFSPIIFTLDENFRSAKQIIEYANSLTGGKEDISRYHYEGELNITAFQNEAEEAQSIRCAIEQLIIAGHKDIEGEVTYDRIAVIARNKYVFANVETELTEANIPFYLKQSHSDIDCETNVMKAFDLILRLIVNPRDLYHKQLLCKLVGQKTPETVGNEGTDKVIEQLLTGSEFSWVSGVIQGITSDGAINFGNVLQSLRSNIPNALSDDDKYMLEKDIDEWGNHWKRFKARIQSENRTLVSFRNAVALGKTQDHDADSGVALLTAHMSKGLEFEVVFVIGLTEGTFPDYRAINSGGDAIAQEKNSMYVATTRAKRLCYLSYPQIKKMPWGDDKRQQISRFVANYKKV